MARPKKLVLDFFVHQASASDDHKLHALCRRFGNDGYAVYFKSLELLCKQDGLRIDLSDHWLIESISDKFFCRDAAHLLSIIQTACDMGLFNKQLWESERTLFSDSLYEKYLDRLEDRRQAAVRKSRSREAAILQQRIDEVQNLRTSELQNSELQNFRTQNSELRTSELQNSELQNSYIQNTTRDNSIVTCDNSIVTCDNSIKEGEQIGFESEHEQPEQPSPIAEPEDRSQPEPAIGPRPTPSDAERMENQWRARSPGSLPPWRKSATEFKEGMYRAAFEAMGDIFKLDSGHPNRLRMTRYFQNLEAKGNREALMLYLEAGDRAPALKIPSKEGWDQDDRKEQWLRDMERMGHDFYKKSNGEFDQEKVAFYRAHMDELFNLKSA